MIHLMCPPTYFDVEYSINPWMDPSKTIDHELARQQWDDFMLALQELGERVLIIDPQPDLPDMTFAGDGGVAIGSTFVPSNFKHSERALEVPHYTSWFEARRFQIKRIPPEISFEGLGDLVCYKDCAVFGSGVRSELAALEYVKKYFPDLHILGDFHIVDQHYFHMTMAFAFIDRNTILYTPDAFDSRSRKYLHELFKHAIPLSDIDANDNFACNNVVVGKTVLLDNCSNALRLELANLGYGVRLCPMSEFKKSGGSVRCLVLSF